MVLLSKFATNLLKSSFYRVAIREQGIRHSHDGKMHRKEHLRRLFGNREQVGYGWNGEPSYIDNPMYPFPSIRYKEPSPEILALREKEKGDWNQLTLDEKKALYRASFRLTFAEFLAPTGDWKLQIGGALLGISFALWLSIFLYTFVYSQLPVPSSFTDEAFRAQLRRQIDLQVNPIEGLASWWDYDKKDWKRPGSYHSFVNPFVNPYSGEWEENDYGKKAQ